jgi:anthranilate synthase component 1
VSELRCETIATHIAPVAAYEALYGGEVNSFLYESLESRGSRGRYSFIGGRPRIIVRSRGRDIEVERNKVIERCTGDPLSVLREIVRGQSRPSVPAPFAGGAVGYLAYDIVRQFERLPDKNPDQLRLPDCYFLVPDEIVVFDHQTREATVLLSDDSAKPRGEEIGRVLKTPLTPIPSPPEAEGEGRKKNSPFSRLSGRGDGGEGSSGFSPLHSNTTRGQFESNVERAKEHIRAGDIFQVVLSQRFEFPVTTSPLALYQSLRVTNPSPYMYFLGLDGHAVIGSSPEILAKLSGRRVSVRPLAGTRPRGQTPGEDDALEADLRSDVKENAEHLMLVDLARNDLGRICDFGSIKVSDMQTVEKYSRVMHLVSHVDGNLRSGFDAFDVVRTTFPAGTVSGAPKIRAMEIIDELEPTRRGLYAGAIGYFDAAGDMDLCIAIRMILVQGSRGYIQAGAGIVADSDPSCEYQETLNKANAMMRAVQLAGATP